MISIHRKKYSNGLRLVMINGFTSNAVTIAAFIKSGFRNDPVKLPGLAHFSEHMLFNGTKSFSSPKAVAQAVEQYGGWHDAFTWIEHQKHIVHVPSSRIAEGVKLLFETISDPIIQDEQIDKEKGVVSEEIFLNKSDPYKAVWDYVFNPIFFQKTHFARPYTGTLEDIKKITRQNVADFIRSFFVPKNIVLLVAGDIDFNEIEEKIGLLNENFKKRKVVFSPSLDIDLKKRFLIHNDKSYYQTSILVGVKTVSYNSPEKYAIELVQAMLGGGYGSSLVQKLRDAGGLTYSWNSVSDYVQESGFSLFITGCSHENVENVSRLILEEYRRIGKGDFDYEEFEIAKGYISGSILANTETGRDYIDWFGQQELLYPDMVLGVEEKARVYNQLSLDDARRVAKKYFTEENIFLGAIGNVNRKKMEKLF